MSGADFCTITATAAIATALAVVWRLYYFLFPKFDKKIEENSERHGGELVAAVLKSHGVKNIFTLCGGHISPILVSCEQLGIDVIDTRHEVNAVFAADAVARLSGTIGVAAVTAGPGLTNTVTAVKNAQMAESPLLLMGGAASTLLKGRGALQDIDQMCLFKPLCKFTATINRVADIIPTLKKAIQAAQSGTPGPVFVEFPIDVLYPYRLVKREAGIKENPAGILPKLVNWYISRHLNNLFAGAWDKYDVTPLPVDIPLPTDSQVSAAVSLIKKSKKPLVLLGSQATLPPVQADDLRTSLEVLGIPCFLGGMSRGLLGKNSPLHIRQKRREALKDADLVILAGTVCDFRLSYGRVLNRKSKIIAVNRDKDQLYKNSAMFWKPTLPIKADAASLIVSISKALGNYKVNQDWIQSLKDKDNEKEKQNSLKADEAVGELLNPLKVLHRLDDVMSDDSIIVADGGDFVGSAAYILRPRGPLRWLDPGAFGTLGVGAGFALGAKLCRPDAEVWIIYGDGSCAYSIAEFDTFTRHKVPVIALVGNDACWSQIAREQVPMFGSIIGCQLAHTDYDKIAEGYGGAGLMIKQGTAEDIDAIFKQAQKMQKDGKPVLINALIGKTNFRDGSISV
eukprot:gene16669-18361_t